MAAGLGQHPEVLGQQPGCTGGIGHGLHGSDHAEHLVVVDDQDRPVDVACAHLLVEEGEALAGEGFGRRRAAALKRQPGKVATAASRSERSRYAAAADQP